MDLHCAGPQPGDAGRRVARAAFVVGWTTRPNRRWRFGCLLPHPRVTAERDGARQDTCLLVKAQPMVVENHRWILVYTLDITQQQFWASLEKVFFHDINNVIQILISASQILSDQQPFNNLIQAINKMSVQLSNEVLIQQALLKTGMPIYKPLMQKISANQVIYDIKHTISNHPASQDKTLVIAEKIPNISFASDLSLVCRVLVNMLIH